MRGVEYIEAEGSGSYDLGWEGSRATRVFYIDWNDRIQFTKELLGYNIGNSADDSTRQVKVNPDTFPGYSFLVCQFCNIRGLGEVSNVNGVASYPFAEVTATYTADVEQENILYTWETVADYITIDINGVGFYYTTG